MKDFSARHRGKVVHFGLWADEHANVMGQRDALSVIEEAAKRTFEEDMRTQEVEDALAFLRSLAPSRPYVEFRAALDIQDPIQRNYAVRHSLVRIKMVFYRR